MKRKPIGSICLAALLVCHAHAEPTPAHGDQPPALETTPVPYWSNALVDTRDYGATQQQDRQEPYEYHSPSNANDYGEYGLEEITRAQQNPVSNLISLPFQNNLSFLESGDTFNALNIQPVIPFQLGDNWNFITRTIIPVIHFDAAPDPIDKTALADIQQSFFFSPKEPTAGGLIWGAGPIVLYPSASEDFYGDDQWGLGPSFVALTMRGPWVAGALLNQTWGISGHDDEDNKRISRLVFQPFVNYNLDGGWFMQSSPLITADFRNSSGERWTVPMGIGAGRTFTIADQPITAIGQAFYNFERPTGGPQWTFRFQWQFLFPQ